MFVWSICMYSMYVFHVLILCVYCTMLIVYSILHVLVDVVCM